MGRKKLAITVRDINSKRQKTYRPITKLGEEGREEQKTERGRIARQNKGRANRMEAKVAKFFGENGNRVPGSGALGAWKGDVIIELKNNPGKILAECKLSAAYNNSYLCPQMRVNFEWLTKLQDDVITTNAKWGILVVHFHDTRDFFVITRVSDLELLRDRYKIEDSSVIQQMLTLPLHDWRYKENGKVRTGYNLIRVKLHELLTAVGLFKAARFLTPQGEYVILSLANYRELIGEL